MIAPFAFLGPEYDATLEQMYTTMRTSDLVSEHLFSGIVSGISSAGYPILHEVRCSNGMQRDHCWLEPKYAAGMAARIGQRVQISGYYRRYRRGGGWQIVDIERVEVVP